MRITIITMVLVLLAILIGGCDADIEGISNTPKVGKGDGGVTLVIHDLGEKNFGTFLCRGKCRITILNPDGSFASIWRQAGEYQVLDEEAVLDGYLAENEFLDFELTEGQTIHVELIESPPENGAEQMTLVSHQQAYQFTYNRGVPTCYLPIYTSVGEPRAYFVELVPDGTCS